MIFPNTWSHFHIRSNPTDPPGNQAEKLQEYVMPSKLP